MADKLNVKAWTWSVGLVCAVLQVIAVALMLGGGQKFIDWIMSIHFVSSAVSVTTFSAASAITGIVAAFVFGAVVGWLFSSIHNWVAKWKK